MDDKLIRCSRMAALKLGDLGARSQASRMAQEHVRSRRCVDPLAVPCRPLVDPSLKLKGPADIVGTRVVEEVATGTVKLIGGVGHGHLLVVQRVLFDSLFEGNHVSELDSDVARVRGEVEIQEMFAFALDFADLVALVVLDGHGACSAI